MRVAMIGTGYVGLVSGSCFADFGHELTCVDKDRSKIDALARVEMPIYEPGLSELVGVNDARKVAHALGGDVRGKTVAVLGLTFKPNTDDMRESPSIPLIIALQDMGAKVRAYDPAGMEQAKSVIGNVAFCADVYDCAKGASALVIVTEWEQFRVLDFARLKDTMAKPLLVDLRNIYRPDEIARHGFAYESVGRGKT